MQSVEDDKETLPWTSVWCWYLHNSKKKERKDQIHNEARFSYRKTVNTKIELQKCRRCPRLGLHLYPWVGKLAITTNTNNSKFIYVFGNLLL